MNSLSRQTPWLRLANHIALTARQMNTHSLTHCMLHNAIKMAAAADCTAQLPLRAAISNLGLRCESVTCQVRTSTRNARRPLSA